MLMTDEGVYDNLGFKPLVPGRERAFTAHAYDLDYIVAVDADPGKAASRAPTFMLGR
jgi:hypothetical protein